ncbi:MAG: PAS domain S-box protein [Bacteroidetes bacterium]|nr:MAG: PAS domain S-box protein [Bacteroidota bacterium]
MSDFFSEAMDARPGSSGSDPLYLPISEEKLRDYQQIYLQDEDAYTKEDLIKRVTFLARLCHNLLNKGDMWPTKEVVNSNDPLFYLLENMETMVLAVDREHQILVANSAFRSYCANAWGVHIHVRQDIRDIVPEGERDTWQGWVDQVLSGSDLRETLTLPLQGKVMRYDFAWRPMIGPEAEILGAFLVARDVTQQHLTLLQLREKEQMLSSINYSIQEGIFRSSPGVGILYVNKAFVEMFGYGSVEEVLSLEPYALYVDTRRRDDFVRIMQDSTTFHNEEVLFKRKDGSTFWGLISSIKVEDHGTIYFDGAIRDVTKLKEAEDRLRAQYEELKKVNQELDLFVHSTSHDLRAPLTTLQGLIEVARSAPDEETRDHYLDLMSQSVHKLDTFIKEIIHYSYNSRLERRCQVIDFPHIIRTCLNELKGIPGYARLGIGLSFPGGPIFHSDPMRVKMIFFNLLANAIWYQDMEKPISNLDIRIVVDQQEARIELEDNGIGIDEAHLDKIFNMFFRGTRKSTGSGIGLYIVREAVHKLEGEVKIHSKLGQGTLLSIRLPQLRE